MYLCEETASMLNETAALLIGREACFKVHYWGIVPQLFDNPVHKHSFFEVCYVMDGEGDYMDEGIHYPLRAGTHFCSRPGVTHQIRTQCGLFLLYVAFELDEALSEDPIREAYRDLAEQAAVCIHEGDRHPSALLWKSLMLQAEGKANVPPAAVPPLAYALLLSFLSLFGSLEQRQGLRYKRTNLLLQQAKLYVRDNLTGPLSLKHVADYLNVSQRHLSRLFAAGIHESFTEFVRTERIRQAAHLLMTSDLSIQEIAEAVGFSSVHYFSRVFAEEKKLPPGKFRKQEQLASRFD